MPKILVKFCKLAIFFSRNVIKGVKVEKGNGRSLWEVFFCCANELKKIPLCGHMTKDTQKGLPCPDTHPGGHFVTALRAEVICP
jgi:hypothetical protein